MHQICQELNCILPDRVKANDGKSIARHQKEKTCTRKIHLDRLVLTSNRTKIDSEIIDKAIEIWEDLLDEAQAKFGDRTIPTNYSCSDFLLGHLKERLASKLTIEGNLIDAIVDYFNQNELIENGCLSLADLSLAGR